MKDNIFPLNIEKDSINNVFDVFNEKDQQRQIINSISNNSLYTDDTLSEVKLCDTPFICHKEKYLVDSDNNKIISLYSTFKFLKEKYGLKNTRKNRIDCIIKKVKTKYLQAIHESIKYCVNLYIKRLPQYFITNIKIEYNKMYLNKTLEQIYTEFKILPSLKEIIEKNLIRKGKKEFLIVLMSTTLKEIYQYYLSSQLYIYYRKGIRKKEGEKIAKLYDYIAQNICEYFLYNKGNKKKININNLKNKNNIYKSKNNVNSQNIINNNKISIQNNIYNNIEYNCNNNTKDSNFDYLGENKITDNKIKFKILKNN
jgi:hypothetical protein